MFILYPFCLPPTCVSQLPTIHCQGMLGDFVTAGESLVGKHCIKEWIIVPASLISHIFHSFTVLYLDRWT